MPIEGLAQCDYAIFVSRSYECSKVKLWPLKLHQTLPLIPVPLKPEDPDAMLDLQQRKTSRRIPFRASPAEVSNSCQINFRGWLAYYYCRHPVRAETHQRHLQHLLVMHQVRHRRPLHHHRHLR